MSESIRPRLGPLPKCTQIRKDSRILHSGHGIRLDHLDQDLRVDVPVPPDEIPTETHARPLFTRKSRHQSRRGRPLTHELQPNRPVGHRLGLQVRVILGRLCPIRCLLRHVQDVPLPLETPQSRSKAVITHESDATTRTAPRPQQPQLRTHISGLAGVKAAPAQGEGHSETRLHAFREPRVGNVNVPSNTESALPRQEPAPVGPRALVPGLQGAALRWLHVLRATAGVEALVPQQTSKLFELLRASRLHAKRS